MMAKLKSVGARPFITPAMGSHGGADEKGQIGVLSQQGVTESSIGAPVRADMAVVPLGEADGIQLFISRLAHQADGIVLINRVKPHTDFTGLIESGIFKMLVISGKIAFFIFLMMWLRWTLPRFRFDQMLRLAWKRLIPITLALFILTVILVYTDNARSPILALGGNAVILAGMLAFGVMGTTQATGRQDNLPAIPSGRSALCAVWSPAAAPSLRMER